MNSNTRRLILFTTLLVMMMGPGKLILGAGFSSSSMALNHPSFTITASLVFAGNESDRVDTIRNQVKSKGSSKSRATDHHIRLAMSHQSAGKVVCVPGKEQSKVSDGYSVNSFEGSEIQVLVNASKNKLVVKGVDKGRLYVFTCMGKQVYFGKLKDNIELDITSLLDGCYTLKIEKEGQVFSRQIIIRR